MKRCFFTIVHSGILTDEPGGQREIVWDTDDALLRTQLRKIPREDVAEVLVQALIWKGYFLLVLFSYMTIAVYSILAVVHVLKLKFNEPSFCL